MQISKSGEVLWVNNRFERKWFGSEAENILKFPIKENIMKKIETGNKIFFDLIFFEK